MVGIERRRTETKDLGDNKRTEGRELRREREISNDNRRRCHYKSLTFTAPTVSYTSAVLPGNPIGAVARLNLTLQAQSRLLVAESEVGH